MVAKEAQKNEKWYSNTHAWVEIAPNSAGFSPSFPRASFTSANHAPSATVGVTRHYIECIGDVTAVMISFQSGEKVGIGNMIAIIQADDNPKDVCSPYAGEVVEMNKKLRADSCLITNGDEGAWLLKVKNSVLAVGLMDENEYKKFCDD